MTGDLLRTEALQITVPGRTLIGCLDCEVRSGEIVALLGGNGAGKSLLLRTLAGLRPADAGRVLLGGEQIDTRSRREIAQLLGFLPQDPESTPQASVAECVLLGRFPHLGLWEPAGVDDEARVARALARMALGNLATRDVGSLSGGEQRRVAIARLLVQSPALYLLDEPTNHLDPAQQIGVLHAMRELAREGAAVIVSLHDPNLALRFADRVLLLAGDGRIELLATPDLSPGHLAGLYGLEYAESRIGAHRCVAPL